MTDPTPHYHSFIVRCWRDTSGMLRGWVIDALSQQSHPFATQEGLAERIESLSQEPVPEAATKTNPGDDQER